MPAAPPGPGWFACDPSPGAHLARAGLAAVIVWLYVGAGQDDAAARALLAAGLMLWSFDALEQSRHAVARPGGLRDPHRWSNAARQGAFLTALLLILLGATPAAATSALVAAAIFGTFWLFLPPAGWPAATDGWDTSRPMTAQPLRGWLYHVWPVFALGLVAGFVLQPAEAGSSAAYVMFQAAFLPFLLPLHPAKGRFLGSAQDQIRVGGLVLLVAGLWLGTA
jgi:hypothetical protein